jgi:hypothetical protein
MRQRVAALHEAATWRGAPEAPREAGRDKFAVAPPPRRGEVAAEERQALREARAMGGGLCHLVVRLPKATRS